MELMMSTPDGEKCPYCVEGYLPQKQSKNADPDVPAEPFHREVCPHCKGSGFISKKKADR